MKVPLVYVSDVDDDRPSVTIRSLEWNARYISFVPVMRDEEVVDVYKEGGSVSAPEYAQAHRLALGVFRDGYARGRFFVSTGG